ncbi:MAG: sigma-54 dependent transcriptional regulator [Pseudomonadota bacterium]
MVTKQILIIEDEEFFRSHLKRLLCPHGKIFEASNKSEAINLLSKHRFDLALIDLYLGDDNCGLDLAQIAKSKGCHTIILTNYDDESYVTRAHELGCDHYLTKDQCEGALQAIISAEFSPIKDDLETVLQEFFITSNKKLLSEIKSLRDRLSHAPSVLLLGETGVGKGRLAKFIHQLRIGKEDKFVSINIAAIPEDLVETELFGSQKGAYTGAVSRMGQLAMADNGTLFLDEVASVSRNTQNKLLKAIEEKSFCPLGSTKTVKSNFQLISATSEDVYQNIQNGSFRIDLFHRISGITITIPPLRERTEDIPLLIKSFIKKGPRKIVIDNQAMDCLTKYRWPGNVRELKNVIDSFLIKKNIKITLKDLPEHIIKNECVYQQHDKQFINSFHYDYIRIHGLRAFLKRVESEAIDFALKDCANNVNDALTNLKIPISTFYRLRQNNEGGDSWMKH